MQQAYAVNFANGTVVASGELLIIRAATAYSSRASLLEILRIEVSQAGTNTSAQLMIRAGLKASAFGTYVSATPAPLAIGTVASAIAGSTSNAAASCGVNASANGAGAFTTIWQSSFNNLNGYLWIPTPEERVLVGPDLTFCVQLQSTPGTLTGWNGTLIFRELT